MDKIGAYTNTANGNDEFTEGDISQDTPATEVDGGWLNAIQRELVKVIEEMGLALSTGDDTLLWQTIEGVYGKTHAGDPNGNVAANVLRERCWDTSVSPPALYVATAADGTVGGTTWEQPEVGASGLQTTDVTFQIPTDYATLQDAVDDLSQLRVKQGVTITLNIESGHALTAGLDVQNGNYGHFVITSTDATVGVSAGYSDTFVISGTRAKIPVLRTLIDINNKSGVVWGYRAEFNSDGEIDGAAGGGIINSASGTNEGANLRVIHNSRVMAANANLSGGAFRNLWCTFNSSAVVFESNMSGAGEINCFVSRGAIVYAHGANMSNAGKFAIRCARAFVTASRQSGTDANLSNAGDNAVECFDNGWVNVREADLSGAGKNAIHILRGGGTISCTNADLSNAGERGIYIEGGGGTIGADGVTINNSGLEAVEALGGTISMRAASISGNTTGFLVWGRTGAQINLGGATVQNGASHGVVAKDGANIIVRAATVTGNANHDLRVDEGSYISANGTTTTNGAGSPALADTNVAAFNSLDSNNGIIWN